MDKVRLSIKNVIGKKPKEEKQLDISEVICEFRLKLKQGAGSQDIIDFIQNNTCSQIATENCAVNGKVHIENKYLQLYLLVIYCRKQVGCFVPSDFNMLKRFVVSQSLSKNNSLLNNFENYENEYNELSATLFAIANQTNSQYILGEIKPERITFPSELKKIISEEMQFQKVSALIALYALSELAAGERDIEEASYSSLQKFINYRKDLFPSYNEMFCNANIAKIESFIEEDRLCGTSEQFFRPDYNIIFSMKESEDEAVESKLVYRFFLAAKKANFTVAGGSLNLIDHGIILLIKHFFFKRKNLTNPAQTHGIKDLILCFIRNAKNIQGAIFYDLFDLIMLSPLKNDKQKPSKELTNAFIGNIANQDFREEWLNKFFISLFFKMDKNDDYDVKLRKYFVSTKLYDAVIAAIASYGVNMELFEKIVFSVEGEEDNWSVDNEVQEKIVAACGNLFFATDNVFLEKVYSSIFNQQYFIQQNGMYLSVNSWLLLKNHFVHGMIYYCLSKPQQLCSLLELLQTTSSDEEGALTADIFKGFFAKPRVFLLAHAIYNDTEDAIKLYNEVLYCLLSEGKLNAQDIDLEPSELMSLVENIFKHDCLEYLCDAWKKVLTPANIIFFAENYPEQFDLLLFNVCLAPPVAWIEDRIENDFSILLKAANPNLDNSRINFAFGSGNYLQRYDHLLRLYKSKIFAIDEIQKPLKEGVLEFFTDPLNICFKQKYESIINVLSKIESFLDIEEIFFNPYEFPAIEQIRSTVNSVLYFDNDPLNEEKEIVDSLINRLYLIIHEVTDSLHAHRLLFLDIIFSELGIILPYQEKIEFLNIYCSEKGFLGYCKTYFYAVREKFINCDLEISQKSPGFYPKYILRTLIYRTKSEIEEIYNSNSGYLKSMLRPILEYCKLECYDDDTFLPFIMLQENQADGNFFLDINADSSIEVEFERLLYSYLCLNQQNYLMQSPDLKKVYRLIKSVADTDPQLIELNLGMLQIKSLWPSYIYSSIIRKTSNAHFLAQAIYDDFINLNNSLQISLNSDVLLEIENLVYAIILSPDVANQFPLIFKQVLRQKLEDDKILLEVFTPISVKFLDLFKMQNANSKKQIFLQLYLEIEKALPYLKSSSKIIEKLLENRQNSDRSAKEDLVTFLPFVIGVVYMYLSSVNGVGQYEGGNIAFARFSLTAIYWLARFILVSTDFELTELIAKEICLALQGECSAQIANRLFFSEEPSELVTVIHITKSILSDYLHV